MKNGNTFIFVLHVVIVGAHKVPEECKHWSIYVKMSDHYYSAYMVIMSRNSTLGSCLSYYNITYIII